MEYDFSVLNDRDFEILANDLLSRHLDVRIERFRQGKDKGVDGRWFSFSGKEAIAQYKNWGGSGFEKLFSHMVKNELPKIRLLSPSRYIIATSVSLSRANKQKIFDALSPYIQSESDIFGREDLHDLIVINPDIEGRNPKLWVATSRVLGQILNSGLIGRSGFALEEIQRFAKRYVETGEAARARAMLEGIGVLIIKGDPGVGKTTLAHQMLLEALGNGYSVYVVESAEEAESAFDEDMKQFFLFDDFLGGNFLEVIRGREDARIVALIRRIAAKKNKKLVLTSRTHILEQGKDCSELFRIENISAREFELSVGHLSLMERAKILYSHIWSGGMPADAIDSIYESRRYLQVVKHRNFNPRLISFVTDPGRIDGLNKDQYWQHVVSSFENPGGIWEHVFRKQVNSDTRDIAYLVGYNGRPISEMDLKEAFRVYSRRQSESYADHSQRFHDGLKLAVGSVVNRIIDREGRTTISLFNPSIGDYLLVSGPEMGLVSGLFKALRTKGALHFLDSLVERKLVRDGERISILVAHARGLIAEGEAGSAIALEVAARLVKADIDWGQISDICTTITSSIDMPSCPSVENALLVILTVLEKTKDDSLLHIVDNLMAHNDLMVSNNAMRDICEIARICDSMNGGARFSAVSEKIVSFWLDNVTEFVAEDMIIHDIYDENDTWFAEVQVQDYVSSKFESMGLVVDSQVIADIAGEVDVQDVIARNQRRAAENWSDESHRPRRAAFSPDAEIDDYFDRTY